MFCFICNGWFYLTMTTSSMMTWGSNDLLVDRAVYRCIRCHQRSNILLCSQYSLVEYQVHENVKTYSRWRRAASYIWQILYRSSLHTHTTLVTWILVTWNYCGIESGIESGIERYPSNGNSKRCTRGIKRAHAMKRWRDN